MAPNPEAAMVDVATSGVAHGVEVAMEFKPVEHPKEPLDNDRPIECPLPEPSILNDGRIWKERVSSTNVQTTADLPVMREGSAGESRSQLAQSNGLISPSISAPEDTILRLLDDCNASGT